MLTTERNLVHLTALLGTWQLCWVLDSFVGALETSAPPWRRPPPDQIPSAARSDSVRHPIRFRPPPNRIPSAVRSDSVRCPMIHPLQSNDVGCTLEFENLIFRLIKYQKTQILSWHLFVSALSNCFVCARTKHHYNIVWANGIIASFWFFKFAKTYKY